MALACLEFQLKSSMWPLQCQKFSPPAGLNSELGLSAKRSRDRTRSKYSVFYTDSVFPTPTEARGREGTLSGVEAVCVRRDAVRRFVTTPRAPLVPDPPPAHRAARIGPEEGDRGCLGAVYAFGEVFALPESTGKAEPRP